MVMLLALVAGGIGIFALFKYVPFLNQLLPIVGFIIGLLVLFSSLKIAKKGIEKGESVIVNSIDSLGKKKIDTTYCANTFEENEPNG